MKAAQYLRYGPPEVLSLSEVERPIPKAKEILVKVHSATVTAGDVRLRASDFPPIFWLPARLIFGLFAPKRKILGSEFAGTVEAVGEEVSKFKKGDEVFGTTTLLRQGSYAEYVCVPQKWKAGVVAKKPKNLSFREAAALPVGAMTAFFLLKKAKISESSKVLVYGASGSVGSYAVQLAKLLGASVTGVCSTSNVEIVKSLGAERVIDYKKEGLDSLSEQFDIVFDAVGKVNRKATKSLLKKGGVFTSVKTMTSEKEEDLQKIIDIVEDGSLKPFIDKTYPLEKIVEAHRYVDLGRKRGNVVIEIWVDSTKSHP